MKTRIYFLDNLRTLLIFLVVVLHAGLVYEHVLANSWIVVDPIKCNSIGLIRMYLDLFIIFTLFFIAGYFTPHSLKKKSPWAFVANKAKRIMIPWFIAVLILIPAYKAIFLFSRGLPQEEWFSYFHFYERAGSDLSFFANNPTQNWLWFLPVLFLFQIVYLALNRTIIPKLSVSIKSSILLSFFIGLAYSLLISFTGHSGWTHSFFLDFQNERLLVYFMAFLLGTLCYKHQVFNTNFGKQKHYLAANVVLTISLGIFTAVALNLFFNLITPDRNYFYISASVDRIFYFASALSAMFSFLYVLLYAFQKYLNKVNKLGEQLNRSSYSVYIIHTVVLGLIALTLLPLPIPSFLKFLILAVLTFAFSNLLIYVYQNLRRRSFSPLSIATGVVTCLIFIAAFSGQPQPLEEKTPTTKNIHAAVISGDQATIRQLIAIKANLNEKEPAGGSSPLITAAVFGQTDIALQLIEAGADINQQNNEGSTALHAAAFFGRVKVVEALLQHGADTRLTNNAGATAESTISIPFESVKEVYDYFSKVYEPMGLHLDYDQIKASRPEILSLLEEQENNSN